MGDEQWDSVDEDEVDETSENQEELDEEMSEELEDMFSEGTEAFENLTILVYGGPGTGKTHFALTGKDPIYAIDTEGPLKALQSKMDNRVKTMEIEYYNDDNEIDGTASLNALSKVGKLLSQRSKQGKSLPNTVVIDSMSDVWKYAQRYMKEEVYRKHGRDQTYQFDWGIANNKMRTLSKQLMNLGCDVVLTAQEQQKRDDNGNPIDEYKAKTWKKLPYQVDVIMRIQDTKDIDIETEEEERVREGTIEKCRPNDDLSGKVIKNPTVPRLKEALKTGEV